MFMFTVAPPMARAIPTQAIELPSNNYRDVARRLGATHLTAATEAAHRQSLFEQVLSEMGLRRYAFRDVQRYMNRQYGWELFRGTCWGFRPMRDQDRAEGHFVAADGTVDNGSQKWRRKHNGCILAVPRPYEKTHFYAKPVPLPVLLTMEGIANKFPTARFFVSDETGRVLSAVKDPFLMVLFEDQQYIIERWDEPGFKG